MPTTHSADPIGKRQPFTEPWRTTARRTGAIALAIGLGVGLYQRSLAAVPVTTVIALWFTLGGHFVELFIRNYLGRVVGGSGRVQAVARLVYWFVGGAVLYAGALATWAIVTRRGAVAWPWWAAGLGFVALELLVHLFLYSRGQPSFYDGRG